MASIRSIIFQALVLSLLLITGWACQEQDPAYIEPKASFSLSSNQLMVFQIVQLQNEGQGQFYAVFTGDPGHEYAKRDQGDTGFKTDVNGNFSYSYTQAGTYTLTFVASGYLLDTGERQEVIAEQTLTVTDLPIGEIVIASFEVGSSAINNNKFLDPISFLFKDYRSIADTIDQANRKVAVSYYRPTRLGEIAGGAYNPFSLPKEINIIPNFKLNTASGTVTVEIEGVDNFINGETRIIHETEDDLRFQEKNYELVNHQGERVPYTVCPMIIPEFLTFSVAGRNAQIELFAGDYHQFEINLEVPDTLDLTNVSPSWTLYDPEYTQVKVNGEEQISGQSIQDFSMPLTYDLLYTQPKDPGDTYAGEFISRASIIVKLN